MRALFLIALLICLIMPVSALDIQAPEVPESGEKLMPQAESFGEGLLMILGDIIPLIRPDLKEASNACVTIVCAALVCSLMQGSSERIVKTADLSAVSAISVSVLGSTGALIQLAADTIGEMTEYSKLLFPVLTSALAAQGAPGTSAVLYAGTTASNTILSSIISGIMVPVVYIFMAISVATAVTGEGVLKKFRDFLKTAVSWCLKTILSLFTAYMGISGVISGTTDAALLKATKATISTMVPFIGGVLSDASEAVLVSAALAKNAAGIYGLFAILAIFLEPFLMIGCHYLMMKVTFFICSLFGSKNITELIGDFSTGMGLLLAMTGSVCVLMLIGTVCFMKGVS